MKDGFEGKGFSAARSGKVNRRVQPQRKIAAPATYDVFDGPTTYTGAKLGDIRKLCPNVNVSTLQRRLQSGERNLVELRKPPAPNIGRQRAKHVKPKVK